MPRMCFRHVSIQLRYLTRLTIADGGQGITAGFFDVIGLSWRLALALNPTNRLKSPDALSDLLDGWSLERKSQIRQSLDWTMKLGDIYEETNPIKLFIRDWWLWLLQQIPPIRDKIQNDTIGAPRYTYEKGMAFVPDMSGGVGFSQVYCCKLDSPKVLFTDDVIFSPEKNSMFQMVVLANSVDEAQSMSENVRGIKINSTATRDILQEATYIVHDLQVAQHQTKPPSRYTVRVATGEEFENSPLCQHRKIGPIGYNPFVLRSEHPDRKYIVLRPDFMIFAACANMQELSVALEAMNRVLDCEAV